MKRIFTILAFIALAVSSLCQNTDEITTDTVEYSRTVEEVASDIFGIVGGMVYSTGVIKVYDITGRLVIMSSQSFNANALRHTAQVYIIVAKEGVIKYNGAWARCTKIEHNHKYKNLK